MTSKDKFHRWRVVKVKPEINEGRKEEQMMHCSVQWDERGMAWAVNIPTDPGCMSITWKMDYTQKIEDKDGRIIYHRNVKEQETHLQHRKGWRMSADYWKIWNVFSSPYYTILFTFTMWVQDCAKVFSSPSFLYVSLGKQELGALIYWNVQIFKEIQNIYGKNRICTTLFLNLKVNI